MAGRRRKWLIAAALLAIVTALAWLLLGRAGKMEVQLVFVGYTNEVMAAQPPPGRTGPLSFTMLKAMVLATNSGTVAVEIYASIRQENVVLTGTTMHFRQGFAPPSGQIHSPMLKPRQTMLIPVGPANFTQPWSTEVKALRRSLSDRIYCKAWDSGNATVQGLMKRWLQAPPEVWANLSPITNPPPEMEPSMRKFGRNSRQSQNLRLTSSQCSIQ